MRSSAKAPFMRAAGNSCMSSHGISKLLASWAV